jgi:hypothetical protein
MISKYEYCSLLTDALLAFVSGSSDVGISYVRSDSFDDHRRAASTPTHNTPPSPTPTSSAFSRLYPLYPTLLSASSNDARHNSRDAVTRDPQRLSCAARASLRSRSLRPPGKGNKKACSRCASRTKRRQECAGVEQLRGYVSPPGAVCRLDSSNMVGSLAAKLTRPQYRSKRTRKTLQYGF